MRRSPRLNANGGASRPGNGSSSAAPAPALPNPQTPHHVRNGAALNNLIASLDQQWNLGLARHDSQLRSPAQNRSIADQTYYAIQRLFYSAPEALTAVLDDFANAKKGCGTEARLNILRGMLRSRTPSIPSSKTVTPKNVPMGNLLSFPAKSPNATFLRRRNDEPDSHYTTAPDPGSSTEEDDDDFETPPSPTPSSRRNQASPHFVTKSNLRKRLSDSFHDSRTSPKLTRTTKGKQSADIQPSPKSVKRPLFIAPSLNMERSFHSATTATTSANTSFNTTVSSSKQTLANTANTSFTSYDGTTERDSKTKITSSTTMMSLDDLNLLCVSTKLERQIESSQDATRRSTSTYGSIDELELAATAEKVETSSLTVFVKPNLPSPTHARSKKKSSSVALQNQSPSRKAYYVRDIPKHHLFVDQLHENLQIFPYYVLFISCRIAEANAISMFELMRGLEPAQAQSEATFWKHLEGHPQISKIALREHSSTWLAARKSFEGFSFKGKLVFNGKSVASKSVFKLELLPLQAEMSCQLQRQFGSDRFLYLTVPSFSTNKPGRFDCEQMKDIEDSFNSWLLETHSFLGRLWRAFRIQPIKKKGKIRRDDTADKRVILFATEGVGIDPLSISCMLNQCIPFYLNKEQNFAKILARIDLLLSKTTPTLTFLPSQIRRKRDIKSDGTPEATEYNDGALSWAEKAEGAQVMNDGCSKISVGAALEIWKMYRKATGSDDAFPSAIQGRIGGAKGMWIICGEPQTRNREDLDIWIEVTDSQLKFEPPWEDGADDRSSNTHRLTFNLLKYSHATGPTDLHVSFIPILVDRGVPKDVIAKLMTDRLDDDRRELLSMISDPATLYNWVTRQGAATKDAGSFRWQAALPLSISDKIKLMLQSGFLPEQAPYLAYALERFLMQRQTWMEQKLRAPLGKATFMYGVADPCGVLHPGEVHIQFSTPFTDEYTGNSYRNLNGVEVLLARQPACRRSDIQKVRVVCSPALSHLVDVVVFPTRGEYPLAGKLQGGDYDGDIFWTCWEECLVEPFRNAPAPMTPLDPSKYGIKTDRRKLYEIMDTTQLSTVDTLLKEGFKLDTAPSLLGKVTNFLEKVSYEENQISSFKIDALCDVHDLLVDALKQGYIFTEEDYNKLIRYKLKCGNPGKPAYKEAMEANAKMTENEGGKPDQKEYKPRPENVLDYLFFFIFQAHNRKTIEQVKAKLPKEEDDDPVLQFPFLQLRNSASAPLTIELDGLVARFPAIRDKWNMCFVNKPAMSWDQYLQALNTVYEQFRALQPSNPFHSDMFPLLRSYLGPNIPVTWETIRASAFYCTFPTKPSLVWHMAGRELAHLKAESQPGKLDVVPCIFANLKPRRIKCPKAEEEGGDPIGEGDGDGEDEDEDFEAAMEQLI